MMSANEFFNKNTVFRFNEFKQYMNSREQGITDKNCYMTLYNYSKKGRLVHIRKGLYAVNSDNLYQRVAFSPLLVAGKATEDAMLVYHSALESHGLAYTDFNEHTYLTTHRTNDFVFQNQHYRAVYRPAFLHKDEQSTQFETVTLLGINIRRSNLERTLIDVLDNPDISGGWEEVVRSIDRMTSFNAERAVDYALSMNHASIVAKLGYFFEFHRADYLPIAPTIINRLLPYIPKQPYYIDRETSIGQGSYIKKWQIIVPNYLHKRQWEEPTHDVDNRI